MIHLAQFWALGPAVCSWQSLSFGDKKRRKKGGEKKGKTSKTSTRLLNTFCGCVEPKLQGTPSCRQRHCHPSCSSGENTGPWPVFSSSCTGLRCWGHGDVAGRNMMVWRKPNHPANVMWCVVQCMTLRVGFGAWCKRDVLQDQSVGLRFVTVRGKGEGTK